VVSVLNAPGGPDFVLAGFARANAGGSLRSKAVRLRVEAEYQNLLAMSLVQLGTVSV
jgi:hypothetical protein